jgi:Carboxypeptidase regulatory-like domain
MNTAAARVTLTLAAALFVAVAFVQSAEAQVVLGTVKAKESGTLLDRAQVFAQNEAGQDIGYATTDADGRFLLKLTTLGRPFRITVRRLGIAPTQSDPIKMQSADTANIEFLVEETSTAPVDTFKVKSLQSINDKALAEAERRGWKMFTPKEVEFHRESARTVQDLLRSWGSAGLQFSSRIGDCVRSMRNNQCLDWVIDGQPAGTNVHMNPKDIYFAALVNRTEAMTQWGNRTPNGAIVIYTRMNGDKIK